MVKLHLAYTGPINPAGATPVLTQKQVWAGLQRKIRFAQEFVPVIQDCKVLSDEHGVVTRDVIFKPGVGPKEKAREIVTGYGNAWVDFQQEDGSIVKNIISDGASGEAKDLHMTYAFEFNFPNVEEGSEEAEEQMKKLKGTSKMAVEKSIETIRHMVIDGRIKE
jgi:hypothetical protein